MPQRRQTPHRNLLICECPQGEPTNVFWSLPYLQFFGEPGVGTEEPAWTATARFRPLLRLGWIGRVGALHVSPPESDQQVVNRFMLGLRLRDDEASPSLERLDPPSSTNAFPRGRFHGAGDQRNHGSKIVARPRRQFGGLRLAGLIFASLPSPLAWTPARDVRDRAATGEGDGRREVPACAEKQAEASRRDGNRRLALHVRVPPDHILPTRGTQADSRAERLPCLWASTDSRTSALIDFQRNKAGLR